LGANRLLPRAPSGPLAKGAPGVAR